MVRRTSLPLSPTLVTLTLLSWFLPVNFTVFPLCQKYSYHLTDAWWTHFKTFQSLHPSLWHLPFCEWFILSCFPDEYHAFSKKILVANESTFGNSVFYNSTPHDSPSIFIILWIIWLKRSEWVWPEQHSSHKGQEQTWASVTMVLIYKTTYQTWFVRSVSLMEQS